MGRLLFLALSLNCGVLSGCGEETESNTLGGSVGRVYNLGFDSVRARRTNTEFAIQYVQAGTVPVQVVINLSETPIDAPGEYDLSLDNGGMVVGSRDGILLPEFVTGQITFSKVGTAQGDSIIGSFESNVETEENRYVVFGTFDTTLEVLD